MMDAEEKFEFEDAETAEIYQRFQNIFDDPTVNRITHFTILNTGQPYSEENFEESLQRFVEGEEYYNRIFETL